MTDVKLSCATITIDLEDVLEEAEIHDIVSHYGSDDLLEEIGNEAIAEFINNSEDFDREALDLLSHESICEWVKDNANKMCAYDLLEAIDSIEEVKEWLKEKEGSSDDAET